MTSVKWDELQMLERIGSGAFGDIFRCRWRGTMVAAKVINVAKVKSEERDLALSDFRKETNFLQQLRHPNVCMLLGYTLTEHEHEVMLSELMQCSLLDVFKTLHARVKEDERRLPMKRALRYAIMFAQGMNYLHLCSPPIIHRDLKPANLLLDFSDTLKVADFGLDKLRPDVKTKRKPPGAAGSGSGGDDDDVVCMTGETGSYRFMAPEVFRHEQYSEKVDVYSFALILYNMLSGHAPWPDKGGVVAVAGAALRGSRPEIPRHWDETMIALIQSCWVEPAEVRPSFTAILDQLHAFHQTTFKVSYEASFKVAAPEAAPAPAPQGAGCAPGCVVC